LIDAGLRAVTTGIGCFPHSTSRPMRLRSPLPVGVRVKLAAPTKPAGTHSLKHISRPYRRGHRQGHCPA
jgi:hypothetical protein